RKAETSAFCTASAASSGSPSVRTATAQSRSRWLRTSSPKASESPAMWAWSRARSSGPVAARSSSPAASSWSDTGSGYGPTRSAAVDLDVGDAALVVDAVGGQRQLGEPQQQVARGQRLLVGAQRDEPSGVVH